MGRVVAAAVYSAGKKVTNITLDEGAAWAASRAFRLDRPGRAERQELANLQRQFNLHELAIEDALENTAGRKLETFGDACSSSPIRRCAEDGKLQFIETHIFAGNGYIITCRNGHSASYAMSASAVRRGRCCWSTAKISCSMPARLRDRKPASQRSHSCRDR
jgi:magnesium transporter